MKLLLLCLFCAYRGVWSEQAVPTVESITAAGGKIEELVTAEPLNVEQILQGIVEVDAKPKTKETISKKGPALFKELADAKILPIAVGEPNGQAVTASGTIEEVVTSKPLNLEQILKGIIEVDAKPKTKESEAKKRPNLFKELAEKYARYFTKDKKKKPDVQILPMPIAVGEPNGQKSVDFSLDGYFYQGDKKIATYRIDFKGVHFKQGALRAQRPSELVDPRSPKGNKDVSEIEIDELVDPLPPKEDKDDGEIEIDELVDPLPPKEDKDDGGEIEIDELVDPRPEKPVESKDNDKELVDPRPDKPSKDGEKPTDELVDPKPVEPIEDKENTPIICFEGDMSTTAQTTTTAERLITAADPAGTTEAQKLITAEADPSGTTEARKQTGHVDPATIEQAGTTTTEAEKQITPEVQAPETAVLPAHVTDTHEAVEKTTGAGPIDAKPAHTTGAGPIDSGNHEAAATTGAGPIKPVENEGDPTPTIGDSTPEVDPVPTKEAAASTTGAGPIAGEGEKSTAAVEVTATPVEEKEAVISTTGAGPIDNGSQKSTEAAQEEEAPAKTTGAGPIDSGAQKSTAAVTLNVDEAEHETTPGAADNQKSTEAAKEESFVSTTGPIDSGIQKSTEAAKEEEEVVAATTGAGPIDAGHHETTAAAAAAAATTKGKEDGGDSPVYTGAPPKYEFGPGKCTIMYEFYFDEKAKRCLAKRFWVCNEEDWKKVSQEKTFAACMKTAPKVMPADNNERTPCPLGKVWSRVPGEPSEYLYLKKCEDHSCPTEGSCVLHHTGAHCCIMPNHQNNMK